MQAISVPVLLLFARHVTCKNLEIALIWCIALCSQMHLWKFPTFVEDYSQLFVSVQILTHKCAVKINATILLLHKHSHLTGSVNQAIHCQQEVELKLLTE